MKRAIPGLAVIGLLLTSTVAAAPHAQPVAMKSVVAGPDMKDSDDMFGLPALLIALAATAGTVATVAVISADANAQST
jgi:hypothetical protein